MQVIDQETGEIIAAPAIRELAQYEALRLELSQARTLDDFLNLANKAETIRDWLKRAGKTREEQNRWADLTLRARRGVGDMLKVMDKNRGGNPNLLQTATGCQPTYSELGLERTKAHRLQQIASVPEAVLEEYVAETKEQEEEITEAGLLKYARGPHVSNNSGENEWYTPPEYIEAARATMGIINLDPASSEIANETVRASAFYGIEDNGLAQDWHGNVWMNPPYAQPAVAEFCQKLVDSCVTGDVVQACVLVNNATDTAWFHTLLTVATALCLVKGRIHFLDPNGDPSGAPLQGQIVLYAGENVLKFAEQFKPFGPVLHV
jgi:hypothetical protein